MQSIAPELPYVRLKTPKPTCSQCQSPLTLLQRKDGFGSMFYVCWHCHRVFQAGVGEVPEERG
jgi:predicted amidophosphoribosyltransferase